MKLIFLTIIALGCFLPIQGQNKVRTDSLMNRELTLEKEYNPTINKAVKLSQIPELSEPQAPKSKVEFSNYAVPFETQSKLYSLSPQTYLTRLNYSKNKGFLTGGISSLLDIDGDLGYQILNSDQDRLNVFFSHRSSRSNISYIQKQPDQAEEKQKFKINDNWGGMNYLHDMGAMQFLADIKYTYSGFNYYGLSIPYILCYIMPGPEPNNNFDKNTNQINQMLEAHIGVSSEKADEFNYAVKIGYTNFRQKYGNKPTESGEGENRILIDGDIHQSINSTMKLGLSGSIKTYHYPDSYLILNDSLTNYWTYSLNPYLYWEDENMNLLLGAKMEVEVGGRQKITASPAIRFNYYPSNQVMLYLLAEGGRKDNSRYRLFYENRYVDPLIRVMDSRSPLDATAGVKFTLPASLSVGVFSGYKITYDEHFFYSNVGAKNHFEETTPMLAGSWITPTYEDANTLKFGVDLKYAFQNTFEINLTGTYYQWTIMKKFPDDGFLHEAWNKPSFETKLNAGYLSPWFPLRFDLSYLGAYGRKAAGETGGIFSSSNKMNDIHDLSIKGTYSFTPDFSVYASLNNLLLSKYDFWWGYPAQGINLMTGFSFLF